MTVFAQINRGASNPEMTLGFLAICALAGYGIYPLIRWLLSGPSAPEPWGADIAAEIAKEEAIPLCHRCLSPHDPLADFCSNCGAPVGQYTNWLPYPYLFSIGHTLRMGTTGEFKHSPLTILGFILLELA